MVRKCKRTPSRDEKCSNCVFKKDTRRNQQQATWRRDVDQRTGTQKCKSLKLKTKKRNGTVSEISVITSSVLTVAL